MQQRVIPSEIREKRQEAAKASAAARRQQRDERITVQIQPAHALTPAQREAWRRLWAIILAPAESGQEKAAVGKTAAGTEAGGADAILRS